MKTANKWVNMLKEYKYIEKKVMPDDYSMAFSVESSKLNDKIASYPNYTLYRSSAYISCAPVDFQDNGDEYPSPYEDLPKSCFDKNGILLDRYAYDKNGESKYWREISVSIYDSLASNEDYSDMTANLKTDKSFIAEFSLDIDKERIEGNKLKIYVGENTDFEFYIAYLGFKSLRVAVFGDDIEIATELHFVILQTDDLIEEAKTKKKLFSLFNRNN